MMRKIVLVACIATLAGFVFAHGNEQHVMGAVIKVSPTSITVQTTTKTTVEVMVMPDTKFTKGDAPATSKDVHVGDRVVIHAMVMQGGKFMAHTVQIGVAKRPPQSQSQPVSRVPDSRAGFARHSDAPILTMQPRTGRYMVLRGEMTYFIATVQRLWV